jgi:hypothetical protein
MSCALPSDRPCPETLPPTPAPGPAPGPPLGLQPGSEVRIEGGAAAGVLLAAEGRLGLAHLKLAPALAAAAGGPGALRLVLAGEPAAQVQPVRPEWWPAEWGYEEAAAAPPGAADGATNG